MPMSGEGPGRESGQMIVADGLVRRYGAVTAVEDVSFEIGRHEVVGLLGHNGAGKTTIMKMIAGYLEPTAGRVLVDGIEVERDRADRKSVVEGKRVSVRVDLGGGRIIKKK